jgi:hypothetical protein
MMHVHQTSISGREEHVEQANVGVAEDQPVSWLLIDGDRLFGAGRCRTL